MAIDICVKLGRRVRLLRDSKGISQEFLANHADINRVNLSRIENGKADPTLRTLRAIAHVLDLTVSELLSELD